MKMKKIIKSILLLLTMGTLVSCGNDTSTVTSDYSMKAVVKNVGEKIEVEVYEAEYAEGIYWINYDSGTVFSDARDKEISCEKIKAGDKIEIFFSGQVMMSYPPQVYAIKIKKL